MGLSLIDSLTSLVLMNYQSIHLDALPSIMFYPTLLLGVLLGAYGTFILPP